MSVIAREKRNILKSLESYLKSVLTTGGWTTVNVTLSFDKVYELSLPSVQPAILDTTHRYEGIGSTNTWRETLMIVRIFALKQSQMEDLSDYLVLQLQKGFPAYIYTKTNGVEVASSNGFYNVSIEGDKPISFDADKSTLDQHDINRTEITLKVFSGDIES